MKKLLTVVLILLGTTMYGQTAYYDAITLKSSLNDGIITAGDPVLAILDMYVEPGKINTPQEIRDAFNNVGGIDPNPFIEISGSGESGAFAGAVNKGFNAIGDLNVTNLADGVAKFLIERSKQELSVAFFDKFKEDLKKYPELKVLFPTTASFTENIEAYLYASFIQTLREAFQADIASLPTGMRNLRNLTALGDCPAGDEGKKCRARIEEIEKFFKEKEVEFSVLYVAATIVMDSLQAGARIPDILRAVAEDSKLKEFPGSNISNGLLLADIFSGSLRSNDPEKAWVTREELKELTDLETAKIYFGLIYQQCKSKNIKFKIGGVPTPMISLLKLDDVKLYYSYLESVVSVGGEVNRLVKEIKAKKKADEKFTADDYVGYLNASVDIVKQLMNWQAFKINPPPTEFEKVIAVIRSAISVYYNIRSDNYASAISNAFIIIDQTLSDHYSKKGEILRYGSFMASIVQAENSDQVANAIEAVALPAGSASIKKSSEWNISLNAYLGGFTGEEFLAEKESYKWSKTNGIAAPIGIGLSHRIKTASITGFISLIDLGAVVSYRLNDSTTQDLPELKLKNIFAPGYGLIFGFPKWPISIGYMRQLGPTLREISESSTVLTEEMNKRWYVFVGVDIPLVNFYSKPKNKLKNKK